MNRGLLKRNKKSLIFSFQGVQRTLPVDEASNSLRVLFTDGVVHVETVRIKEINSGPNMVHMRHLFS